MSAIRKIAAAILVMAANVSVSLASETESQHYLLGSLNQKSCIIPVYTSKADSTNPLTDSLAFIPGLITKRINGLSGNTSVRSRGARSIDSKLYYNGYGLSDPGDAQGSSNPLWGDLSIYGVDKVEVLNGPSSSVYGSRAIGGVVNFVPNMSSPQAFYEYGTFNTHKQGFKGYGLSFMRTDSEGFDEHDDYSNMTLGGVHPWGHNETTWVYSETDAYLNNPPLLGMEDTDDENDSREYRTYLVGNRFIGAIGMDYQLTNSTHLSSSSRRFSFNPNSDGMGFESDGYFQGQAINSRTVLEYEAWNLSIGHEYEHEWLKQASITADSKDEADHYTNVFMAEKELTIANLSALLNASLNHPEHGESFESYGLRLSHPLGQFVVSSKRVYIL